MYGKITMLVGISTTYEIGHIYMVTNEQTYATTLVDNYIDPYNEDSHDLDDVSCGATYGATLIKDMAKQAQNYAIDKLGGGQ